MKPKAIIKITIDILMTLALLFLMGYQFWSDVLHEWAGTAMFLLFLLHHMLNANWYKSLFKNKYTPMRIFQLIVDVSVFLTMLGLMVSGIMPKLHRLAWWMRSIDSAITAFTPRYIGQIAACSLEDPWP